MLLRLEYKKPGEVRIRRKDRANKLIRIALIISVENLYILSSSHQIINSIIVSIKFKKIVIFLERFNLIDGKIKGDILYFSLNNISRVIKIMF